LTDSPHGITIEARHSLGISLTAALSLLSLADEYEGFDPSIYSIYDALGKDLRADIRVLVKPFGNALLFDGLMQDKPDSDELPSLIRWISDLSADRILHSHLVCLSSLIEHADLQSPPAEPTAELLQNPRPLAALLRRLFTEKEQLLPAVRRIAALLSDPEAFRANLLFLITRFWDRHYRFEYPRSREFEERAVAQLQELETERIDFRNLFQRATGRPYPESAPELSGVRGAVFIPTAFIGPYVSIDRLAERRDWISVVYSGLGAGEESETFGTWIKELLPPLKALADETRLEILRILSTQELYAQQIVARMSISQPAVSRHLRFMVACGVLRERKQNGMKFYSIDRSTMTRLREALGSLEEVAST
jgi:ArsR family transcriptional regulator